MSSSDNAAGTEVVVDNAAVPTPKPAKPARKKPQRTEKSGRPKAKAVVDHKQSQRDREFGQHKAHILSHLSMSACDLSPKGSVDVKCYPVMDVLNTHSDYITTSSCSGRIALFHTVPPAAGLSVMDDGDVDDTASVTSSSRVRKLKRGDESALGWVVVKHGMLTPAEMALVVRYLAGPAEPDSAEAVLDAARVSAAEVLRASQLEADPTCGFYAGELEGTLFQHASTPTSVASASATAAAATPETLPPVPALGTVCVKMEPFVMHVECRTMESAKLLHSAAVSDAGYRNSGVVPPGRKIMCAIRCAAGLGLEVPVVMHGENYVQGGVAQRRYLWSLLELANEKMLANERKTKLLLASVERRVKRGAE